MGKRLTRNFSMSFFRYLFLAIWLSSLYLTYIFASNQSSEVKVPLSFERHKIRNAKSLYEYSYHEKVSS